MIIYSNREIRKQLDELQTQRDSLKLTDWEKKFLDEISFRMIGILTDKQKSTISTVWEKYLK